MAFNGQAFVAVCHEQLGVRIDSAAEFIFDNEAIEIKINHTLHLGIVGLIFCQIHAGNGAG
jgi:hypothetical protein